MTATNLPSSASLLYASILDASFAEIDWQAPWLGHLNQLSYLSETIKQLSECNAANGQQIDSANETNQIDIIAKVLNTALNQQSASLSTSLPTTKATPDNQAYPLNFVSQNTLPEGIGYEQFIGTTGNIPTRDNLHDLFNGSIWLTFPKTKALLNYYHMLEIAKHADGQDSQKSRGRVRDTITVFDENGAVLLTSKPSIGKALVDFDWQGSLVEPRDKWDDPNHIRADSKAAVYIFGHALLEQLIQPRKTLCAHSVVIYVEPEFFTLSLSERMTIVDSRLALQMHQMLAQKDITPRQLAPLPILGVPHFWPENSNASFYDDSRVFRSGRQRQK